MRAELFQTIVDQVSAFSEHRDALFYLHICGEPLLHPQITELIGYAVEKGFKPILATNATLLTCELARRLVQSGLHKIEFSFEGIDAPTYENVRVGAKFDRVWNQIQQFLKINEAGGHPVRTDLVIVDLPDIQQSRISAFRDQMSSRFDRVLVSGYFDWLGRVPGANYPKESYVGCAVTETDLNVLWDGRVVPCCQDVDGEMVIGDFRRQCFVEVWSAMARHSLAMRLKRGDLSGLPCNRCSVPWNGRNARSKDSSTSSMTSPSGRLNPQTHQ